MDIRLARSILFEARKGEIYEKEIPEVDAELIEEASYFVVEAKKAYEEGWGKKDSTVVAIYNLAEAGNGDGPSLIEKEHFPIPADIDKPPEMPTDITKLDDLKIRKLYSEFNAVMARANWVLSVESADLANATHMRDDAYRRAYVNQDKIDDDTGKPKTTTALDLEAKSDKKYIEWNLKVLQHTKNTIAMKALATIYSNNVDRLSRDMTFRDMEWQRNR